MQFFNHTFQSNLWSAVQQLVVKLLLLQPVFMLRAILKQVQVTDCKNRRYNDHDGYLSVGT